MAGPLSGLRVVEAASFVAAPLACQHMAQLGAEVIRIEPLGGGPDAGRWPLAPNGASFYREGLNKGKKSVTIDLSKPHGRELAYELIAAPGSGAGLFVTNYPPDSYLSHEALAKMRSDLITVRVMGWADGHTAVDYTVNAATGLPLMTGPQGHDGPVNHVLPAWDLITGTHAAFALMVALAHRNKTGQGQEVCVPLGEVAIATLGHLGQIAEVVAGGKDRPRVGNALFGAFGRDFRTKDGRDVMIVAITPRQWRDLKRALDVEAQVASLEAELGVSLSPDPSLCFAHRDRLFEIIERAVCRLNFRELGKHFEHTSVCWDVYQSLSQAMTADPRFATSSVLQTVSHPGGSYPTPVSPATYGVMAQPAAATTSTLGADTEEVLAGVLGLTVERIAALRAEGLIAEASAGLTET